MLLLLFNRPPDPAAFANSRWFHPDFPYIMHTAS